MEVAEIFDIPHSNLSLSPDICPQRWLRKSPYPDSGRSKIWFAIDEKTEDVLYWYLLLMLETRVWTPESVKRALNRVLYHGWSQNSGPGIRKPLLPPSPAPYPTCLLWTSVFLFKKCERWTCGYQRWLPKCPEYTERKTTLGITWHNMGSRCGTQDNMRACCPHGSSWPRCCPFTLFFLQRLRNLKPYSYWVKAEEDRATILPNTQYPTVMLKQKRACARNLVHQCLCRGITSCENPFPPNVDYDPEVVMRFL